MAQVKTKKEIVKMLLKNKVLEDKDETELMEMLFDQEIAVDVDKYVEENATWKDKLADKITEKAGSWGFIIGFIVFLIKKTIIYISVVSESLYYMVVYTIHLLLDTIFFIPNLFSATKKVIKRKHRIKLKVNKKA